jgi:hypothetical protein
MTLYFVKFLDEFQMMEKTHPNFIHFFFAVGSDFFLLLDLESGLGQAISNLEFFVLMNKLN